MPQICEACGQTKHDTHGVWLADVLGFKAQWFCTQGLGSMVDGQVVIGPSCVQLLERGELPRPTWFERMQARMKARAA